MGSPVYLDSYYRPPWEAVVLALGALLMLACDRSAEKVTGDEESAAALDSAALRSLPYARWVPTVTDGDGGTISGVVRHDQEHAVPGLNLFGPRHLSEAMLIDMQGKVLHRWAVKAGRPGWQHVELLHGGDLLVISKDRAMARLGWDSEVKAIYRLRVHHDVDVGEDGRVYIPSRRERLVEMDGKPMLILDDSITILSPSGEVEKSISLFDHIGHLIAPRRRKLVLEWMENRKTLEGWAERGGRDLVESREVPVHQGLCLSGGRCDVFHLNSLEILDRDVAALGPAGHLLISVRELNRIMVINPEDGEMGWSWGPSELEAQHHPTLLDNGHVLVFDNGTRRRYSRVLEVDPASGAIVWQYRARGEDTFFSRSRGANQRLPGGNTLITESDFGHVFEVTPAGEIVWEFFNPFLQEKDGESQRSAIYRMMRVTDVDVWGIRELLASTG
jgi:hypothetical protein